EWTISDHKRLVRSTYVLSSGIQKQVYIKNTNIIILRHGNFKNRSLFPFDQRFTSILLCPLVPKERKSQKGMRMSRTPRESSTT
ncbi:hypothetical protein L9F63_004958, partial [Diploptera punctata]